jgi:uncharacterized protein with HEPN domain
MTRSHRDYLRDMLTGTVDAQSFVSGWALDDFLADKEKQYAVIRALEIIGEAAAHIPPEVRTAYPDIP